ncbi:MAG: Grx4 family monothiol glutaredoxin [Pseudomonadota bacterium]|nr:Grx4 family monothiol glutaredoxin [Pseudomonadota bacterium]
MDVTDRIKEQISSHPVVLFMKGTPDFPMCGFSSRVTQILKHCGAEFGYVNILDDPEVREEIKRYSDWPTFPQLYINGELVGGCDIAMSMYESGDLQKMLAEANGSK